MALLPAARFAAWIADLAFGWKDTVREWMASWVTQGAKSFLEDEESKSIENVREFLSRVKDDPNTPPELKRMVDSILGQESWLFLLIVIPLAIMMFIPMVTGAFQPIGNLWNYIQERMLRTSRLDPVQLFTVWRRDKAKYAELFQDLEELGWSDKRKEAWEELTRAFPSLRDVIGFYAHEVFEPDMVSKYELEEELPPYEGTLFEALGVSKEIATNYWIDHWQHASWVQIVEMLHRGLVTEQDVYEWFRLVEIPPFWRHS